MQDKTNEMTCVPSKETDQQWLIGFTVLKEDIKILHYLLNPYRVHTGMYE